MSGDLLAASFDRRIYRVDLDASGSGCPHGSLAEIEGLPLDVTTQPDDGAFPGTIWAADWISGDLVILEPRDRQAGAHWERLAPSSFPRQEVAWVRAGDRFYLAGGDRATRCTTRRRTRGTTSQPLPEQLDHIQGVAVGGRIYYIGGLSALAGAGTSAPSTIYDPGATASAEARRCRARVAQAASPSTTGRSTTRAG